MSSIAPSSPSKPHALISPWLKGPWGIVGVGLILYTSVFLVWTYFHWGGEANVDLIGNLAILPPMFIAMLVAWRVAAEKQLDSRLRRAWFLMGLGIFFVFLGEATWAYLENVLHVEPFPSIADIFFLAFYPLMLWGLLTLPGGPQNRRERLIFWFELMTVMTTAVMFVGYFLIIPTAEVNSSDLLSQLLATVYPIFSLILLGGVLALLLRPAASDIRIVLLLLLLGISFFLASDLAFGYASLAGRYVVGSWIDTGWHIAQVFVVLAALRQMHRTADAAQTPRWFIVLNSLARVLPAISVALGYGLAFYVILVNFNLVATWLLIGALLLTVFAIARQIVSPAFANLPIRSKVILTFILVSTLSVSLVILASYLTIRRNLESTVGLNLKAHAGDRAETISGLLSKQSDALEGFVLSKGIQTRAARATAEYGDEGLPAIWDQLGQRDLAWKAAADGDPLIQDILNNEAADELREFQANFSGYTDLLLTDKYGGVIAATIRPTTYDQSIFSWWQAGFHKGQGAIYFSQPILNPSTGSRDLMIVMPVYSHLHSELVGLLVTRYSLKGMTQMLAAEDSIQTNENSLVLPTGQMLTSNNKFVFLDQATWEHLQATEAADFTLMTFEGRPQLVSQSLVSVDDLDPEESPAFADLNWKIVAYEEPAEAFAPLNAAWRMTLLSTFLVLVLTAGLAVFLAQVLVAPIATLTGVTRQIGMGNLTTLKAPVESRDEIGTLASTFNNMLDALSRTQKELEESEALYRSLVDHSPDVITVHSKGRILFINPTGVKLLGASSAADLIGKQITDVVSEQDREQVRQGIEMTQKSRESTPLLQQTFHRKDGTSFEAEYTAVPLTYAGEPAIQFVMRDITERKQLEEQWKKFKLGIEYSDEAVFMTDVDGTIRYVNPAFEKLYGYFWDEAVGQTPRILKSGRVTQEYYEHFWQTLLAKGSTRGEIINRTKDGRLITIEGAASPILDQDGNILGFLAVQRDVTERKKAEEKIHQLLSQVARQRGELEIRVAERTEELNELNQRLQVQLIERQQLLLSLRESEERFHLLFDASPDAIFLIDPHSSDTLWPIVDCNQAAGHMNGYTRQELLGQSIDILNQKKGNPEDYSSVLENLRQIGVARGIEVGHLHKDGHVFPIEYSTTLIKVGDRELVLGIDRDITERKQAEEDLRQAKEAAEASQRTAEEASRAKSEFLSRMSHELRTPMNAILGFAQLLELSQKEPLTSSQRERVKQIIKGGQHLLDLINEILDISRIEANRLHVSPEPVSVRESVQEVLDLSVPLAVKRHIQIVTRLGQMDANPFVLADRQRLKQVLLNLLSNSVKYNYDGGSVIITCQSAPADKWRISVADSGPGISPENLARLFVPFERLNADQPNVEGTGLGLVLAKRLVELMHGQMGVESTLGRGTTFWLELPSTESPLAHAHLTNTTNRLPTMSADARTVLYVEDNVANFELIQQVLADYSQIKLVWAADAKAGIEATHENHPDLILLDLHLGGSDGAELLEQLRQQEETAGIPVIVVSADATSGQARRLIALGAQAYLTKPLDVKQFVQLVEELLSEKVG